MQTVFLVRTQQLTSVSKSEAHRLIELGEAILVTNINIQQYQNKMMSAEKGKTYVTKRQRTDHRS